MGSRFWGLSGKSVEYFSILIGRIRFEALTSGVCNTTVESTSETCTSS